MRRRADWRGDEPWIAGARPSFRAGRARGWWNRRIEGISPAFAREVVRPVVRVALLLSLAGLTHAATAQAQVPAQAGPADLTLRYVARLPRLDYVWASPDPGREGWPRAGDVVTWRAQLKNWTGRALRGVDYEWRLDGEAVAAGRVDVPARGEASLDLDWSWEQARHTVEIVVDAAHRFTVPGGQRHRLLVHSDALAVGFYVEQSVYDYFRQHQHELGVGHSSFEDWAQFQILRLNELFAAATFDGVPEGVLDRVRLDRVTVVPDATLPLDPAAYSVGGSFDPAQARPDVADRTVDLQWGFPRELLDTRLFEDTTTARSSNQFYYSGFVQHELGHARYLIDLYGFNVYHDTNGSAVEILEGDTPIAGSRFMPGTPAIVNGDSGLLVHATVHSGLMNAQWTWIERYSALALNRIAGQRATLGNYNEPENIGAFLTDLPADNRLTLLDTEGTPLAGASVSVYQASPGDPGALYAMRFDDEPDLELHADGDGSVRLGQNPFSATGAFTHDLGFSNTVAIVRVEHEGRVGYGFIEAADFNVEYWLGRTELGEHELRLELVSP